MTTTGGVLAADQLPTGAAFPDPHVLADALTTKSDPLRWERLSRQIEHCGRCARPVRVRGQSGRLDPGTGELQVTYTSASEPDRVALLACKTRKAALCPSCGRIYRGDAYQLITAGLIGGKNLPSSVAGHPAVFATFTAPGFGPVHRRGRDCHPAPRRQRAARPATCPHGRPRGCGANHGSGDPLIGAPLCPGCYDTAGAVLFNACAPELWRRTMIAVRRQLARHAGMSVRTAAQVVRVSYVKVAEFQHRGVIHFHAVLRIDGVPAGPTHEESTDGPVPPPAQFTEGVLAGAVRTAAAKVSAPGPVGEPIRWGNQLDVRPIPATTAGTAPPTAAADSAERDVRVERVPVPAGSRPVRKRIAGYLAKYSTKAAEDLGAPLLPLRGSRAPAGTPDAAAALINEALELACRAELSGLRLAARAHQLGYGGHFLTKSRGYSTTFAVLRAARAAWRAGGDGPGPGSSPETTAWSHWTYHGCGYATAGEA